MTSLSFGMLIIGILILFYLIARNYKEKLSSDGANGSPIATKIPLQENRIASRIDVKWPVTIETPAGIISAETVNISISGVFICCQKLPQQEEKLRLTMNPPNHQSLTVTAEVVWSNFNVPANEAVNRGIGIRFTEISSEDHQFLARTVTDHYQKLQEQRDNLRVDVKWPVTIESTEGLLNGETMNVSISGAFICCQKLPPLKEKFRLTMNPPGRHPLTATAEVIWSNFNVPESQVVNRGMGIRYEEISDEDRQFIKKTIKDPPQ
jgi:hypothetical protein